MERGLDHVLPLVVAGRHAIEGVALRDDKDHLRADGQLGEGRGIGHDPSGDEHLGPDLEVLERVLDDLEVGEHRHRALLLLGAGFADRAHAESELLGGIVARCGRLRDAAKGGDVVPGDDAGEWGHALATQGSGITPHDVHS